MAGFNNNYGSYSGYGGGTAPQQSPSNSMIAFISDDAMASNYPVAPGTTVALINANDPANGKMFIKSTEPNGMPNPMRIFSLQEITPQKQSPDSVSRQEFDNLSQQMAQLMQMVSKIQPDVPEGGNKK